MPDGDLMICLTQATGPVEGRPRAEVITTNCQRLGVIFLKVHMDQFDNEGDRDDAGLADYDRHAEVSGATEGASAADVPRESPDDGGSRGTQTVGHTRGSWRT